MPVHLSTNPPKISRTMRVRISNKIIVRSSVLLPRRLSKGCALQRR
jgi:hypothetical protein